MNVQAHEQLKSHIWEIANRLRGPYRPPQYRLVMLPMVVLRRLDCVLEPTKDAVLKKFAQLEAQQMPEAAMDRILGKAADPKRRHPLYNTSPYTFARLLGDAENIAPNFVSYISGFSPTARRIFERFKFNDQIEKLDASNRLYTIVKAMTEVDQLGFTSVMKKPDGSNRRCLIDVTLAVNGIPVVTAELKNPLTGQRAADAVRQYSHERDERDLLFAFKGRALVHFAVDPDEVWMTTRLRGKETHFLPFNRGHDHGAGNPAVEGNWKTHYLWDEVLQADSLLEILQRFMHLEVKEKQVKTDKGARTIKKEIMIFPR